MAKERINTSKLALSGVFLAVGMVLPFVTLHIPAIGNMLSPMHIPVLLCGFICGWPYGLAVGLITPILRSLLFGMPPLMPNAAAMMFELAVYGFLAGLMTKKSGSGIPQIYITLATSMVCGRMVWGIASWLLFQMLGRGFTWQIFFTQAFVNALPGIILQVLIIPPIVRALKKEKAV